MTQQRILLFLKGMAMGAADSVPGVSGGTVALITNIYEELIDAIKSIGWQALMVWKNDGYKAAWNFVHGSFLLTLVAGILTSLVLLGRVILFLMENYQPYLMAFFAGLVLASIRFVAKNISSWNAGIVLLLFLGTGFAMLLSIIPMGEVSNNLACYFIYGAIAICAMILPGISGAFILVLLGAYVPVLEALTQFNVQVIIVFAMGCMCGLMLFSRLLSWLLHHYRNIVMATLTGMLTGSLFHLWPWQLGPELSVLYQNSARYEHVMPDTYAQILGTLYSPYVCLVLLLAGAAVVFLLEYVTGNYKAKNNK